jgi:hypothetical protein
MDIRPKGPTASPPRLLRRHEPDGFSPGDR